MIKSKILSILLICMFYLNSAFSVSASEFTDGVDVTEKNTTANTCTVENASDITSGEEFLFTDEPSQTPELTSGLEPETEGLIYEYIEFQDGYRLVKGVNEKTVTIHGVYQGKPVLEIGEQAFAGCQNLETLNIYNDPTIITICKYAFKDCTYLRRVSVGYAVNIENYAFWNCPRLAIFDTGSQQFGNISDEAFDTDSKVLVTSYGGLPYKENGYPFYDADIEDIPLLRDRGVIGVRLGDHQIFEEETGPICIIDFDNSRSSINLFGIFSEAEIIKRKAFYGCDKITEVILSPKLKQIETKAFKECTNLQKIQIPESVTEIADDAFDGCRNVTFSVIKGSYGERYAKEHSIPSITTPVAPKIEKVTVNNNTVTLELGNFSGDMYYCILGTRKTLYGKPVRSNRYARIAVGQTGKRIVFRNIQKGTYYIGTRALDNDGTKKYYSNWSDLKKIKINVFTPDRPEISTLKRSGKNVTLKVSLPRDTTGYNIALSKSTVKSDNSTNAVLQPSKIAYRLNGQKNKSATLRNISSGTYFVGIQAYKIQNGKKIYSQWSPLKKISIR
ncbi:MAG: leucine-rich repeat domain-containing protein [Eubacteriales bacterium]|nr:leucine-rich repeat domain-containing protein [Eubacteriales bacterium]